MPSAKEEVERIKRSAIDKATSLSEKLKNIGFSCGRPENSYDASTNRYHSVITCELDDENRTLEVGERIPQDLDESHLRHINFVNAPQKGPWTNDRVHAFAETFNAGEVDILAHEPNYTRTEHRNYENEDFINFVFQKGRKVVMIQAEEPTDPSRKSRVLLTVMKQKTKKK